MAASKRFLRSEIGLTVLEKLLACEAGSATNAAKDASHLTAREREILQLIATGLPNQQTADELFTSRRTVETHRQHLIDKTGVINTPALIKHAVEQGWLHQ